MLSNFHRSLKIPDSKLSGYDTRSSMKRLKPFTSLPVRPGEDIRSAAAVLQIHGRAAFFAPDESYVLAHRLIQAYNRLDQSLKQKPLDPKILKQIEPFLKSILPKKSDLVEMKIAQLVEIFQAIYGGKTSSGEDQPGLEQAAPGLFSCLAQSQPALQQIIEMGGPLNAAFEALQSEAEIKKFFESKVLDWMRESVKQEVQFTQENLSDLSSPIAACAKKHEDKISELKKKEREIEAQMSLILNALSITSRQ
jgi:hypothetical protein